MMSRFRVDVTQYGYFSVEVEAEDTEAVWGMIERGELFLDHDGDDEETTITELKGEA